MPAGATWLLTDYERSLAAVHGYLLARCGTRAVAEDLTSETFLGAVDALHRGACSEPSTAWLIGIARHKLVDHWRRTGREERSLRVLGNEEEAAEEPWDVRLDAARARQVLEGLGPHHRAALVLRYLDDLPVPEVASLLGRTVHATEALLVRARAAFRRAYTAGGEHDA